MLKVLCPCGAEFSIAQWRMDRGVKYCSRPCLYEFRPRVSNSGQFKKGQRASVNTEFKAGIRNNPDGEIKKGQRLSPSTEFGQDENHPGWKGDQVGYLSLHKWVYKHKGKAATCEECGRTERVQWANKSFEYKRELDDWLELCYWCHREYDKTYGWGVAACLFESNAGGYGKRKVSL